MVWRVEIRYKEGVFDALSFGIQKSVLDLGIASVQKLTTISVYHIKGALTQGEIEKIAKELLLDPVTQEYSIFKLPLSLSKEVLKNIYPVEIAYNPGVMDPVEASTIKGIKDFGFNTVEAVRTSKKYLFYGELSSDEIDLIANKVLANKLIQHVVNPSSLEKSLFISAKDISFKKIVVPIRSMHSAELMKLSKDGQLFLNIQEMQTIQGHFKKIKRDPTDCELETIAQTWSEHCYHKTFRGNIRYTSFDKGKKKTQLIKSLFKSTIAKATFEIKKPWCVSVFHDNAGVIKFDQDTHVCFKVETHNHPSALEPFGGANTGIGGVIRDTLGTGLGGKPICSTDVFCFAPPDFPNDHLPAGALHPKRVMKGVVSGVRDYGNKMGIPTINGAIVFDKHFVGNPLVYCGSVGLIPKDKVKKQVHKGDLVVVMGGKTGRDGIHGATFSSGELTSESEVVSSGAVQIGDPIQEKKVLDALLKARDQNLYSAVTDCGAGGLSSAVGEMGKDLGARVDLEKVPLKYHGLNYTEIWISESQERMVLSVPPSKAQALLEICETENVEATVIGEFISNGRLELFYDGNKVCDLDMDFLHEGIPTITKEAEWKAPVLKASKISEPESLNEILLKSLSHYNVCSKEWVIRQYDHEVQGASVIKPLSGISADGPSDASVVAPIHGSKKGIAVSNGINIRFGMIDPYWMSASCIDEALRQIISVGGDLDKIAILDNFCWGNPDKKDRLGSLVRAALGCYNIAVGYKVPFISGKDSLYNEYTEGNQSIAIPGTILISAIGIVDDVTKCVTMDLKEEGNVLYVLGWTYDELGGSIYGDVLNCLGTEVPQVNTILGTKIFNGLSKAVKAGLVRSIHDCSEGGLAVTLAEMAFSGGLGAHVSLTGVPYKGKAKRNDYVLFSESNTRFVVEVSKKNQKRFEQMMKGLPLGMIGEVNGGNRVTVRGLDKSICVDSSLEELKEAWQKPLRW